MLVNARVSTVCSMYVCMSGPQGVGKIRGSVCFSQEQNYLFNPVTFLTETLKVIIFLSYIYISIYIYCIIL
jgi:hypothetical protein